MKRLMILTTVILLAVGGAAAQKPTLICFQGSDWCIPCIRMDKALLEQQSFQQFADSSLTLVKADFPRLKKNKLSKDIAARNAKLADQYNTKGVFPMMVLLDAKGKVLHAWEGEVKLAPQAFVAELKQYLR